MSGIVRNWVVRASPALRPTVQAMWTRGIKSNPPKVPLSSAEQLTALTVLSLGCLVVPGYIMTHLDKYKARDE